MGRTCPSRRTPVLKKAMRERTGAHESKWFLHNPHGTLLACVEEMRPAKRVVYVLRTCASPTKYYVGLTSDVSSRLIAHNHGDCPHTAPRRPWELHVVIQFSTEQAAARFERYLKSGSGRAFARRHFG